MTTPPPNPPDEGGSAQPPATPPPPPEPPVPAPMPAGAAPFQVGDAFNYGWKKFQEYLGPILIAMIVLFLVGVAINWVGVLIGGGFGALFDMEDASSGFTGAFFSIGYLLFSLVSALVSLLIQAAIVRGALAITKGEQIDVNTFLSMDNVGQIVLAAIILAVGTAIGLVLCVIPGLVLIFFSQFTYHFIIDKGMTAMDGSKASFAIVNRNLGSVIGLFFASILAFFVGAILCGIGLIVAIPVTIIATAYAYRLMSGQTVAP